MPNPVTFEIPLSHKISLIARKIVIGLLLFNSVLALWSALRFIVIEYPLLDQQLKADLITFDDIITLITMMLVTLLNLTLSVMLALYLNKLSKDVARILDLVVAILFLVASPFLQQWLIETQIVQHMLEQILL